MADDYAWLNSEKQRPKSFLEKLQIAHRIIHNCAYSLMYTRTDINAWIRKGMPFEVLASRELKLVEECHDFLADMITIMKGDTSETRRNDEPNKEGRVDTEHPLE